MPWAGGVWHATGSTGISDHGAGVNVYYDKKFLRSALNVLRTAPLGQKRPLPKGEGDDITFFRYNQVAISMSGSYLTEGTNPDPTVVTGQNITATIAEWGNFSQHSRLLADTHIDRNLAGLSALWGEHAGSTMDLLAAMGAATGGAYPYRADEASGDSAYTFDGTVDSATSTTVVDADLTSNDAAATGGTGFGDADDDLNQSIIVMLTGTSAGQARPVTDYVALTGTVTVSPAWDVTPVAGDTFHVCSAHALATTDKLTTSNVRHAVTILRNNKAAPISGGMYVGVLCPDTEEGLMDDTTWTNVMQYKDRPDIKVNGLFAGEVGEWGGVRWVRTTLPFRFPITTEGTAGSSYGVGPLVPGTSYTNYSSTGAIYSTFIFGREAFGVTTFEGNNFMRPGIIKKNPGPQDTSNPLNMFSTVGWYMPGIAKGLNPLFGIQIWSGA
jgi:N4-gp56 family major capsid protein